MSLAAESQIIRREEQKYCGEIRCGLHEHRVHDVRRESRSAHLAYGFLRNTPYTAMERKPRTKPDWKRIEKLVQKYGDFIDMRDVKQRLEEFGQLNA